MHYDFIIPYVASASGTPEADVFITEFSKTVLKQLLPQATRGTLPVTPGQISMSNEIRRKLIHLSSIAIPVGYWFLTREQALWGLIPMTLIAVATELLRRRFTGFERWFSSLFGSLLRPHESSAGAKPDINGATFVLLSATICVVVFPKVIAITAFAVLIISDTASALYGRRFGKRKFFRKSVEGSAAFFVTAMLVVLTMARLVEASWEFLLVGAVASVVATVVEAVSHGDGAIDDNLSIPTAFGAVLWAGLALLSYSVGL